MAAQPRRKPRLGATGFLIPLGLLLAAMLIWRRRPRAAAAAIGWPPNGYSPASAASENPTL
jgi:hypothetical protein